MLDVSALLSLPDGLEVVEVSLVDNLLCIHIKACAKRELLRPGSEMPGPSLDSVMHPLPGNRSYAGKYGWQPAQLRPLCLASYIALSAASSNATVVVPCKRKTATPMLAVTPCSWAEMSSPQMIQGRLATAAQTYSPSCFACGKSVCGKTTTNSLPP